MTKILSTQSNYWKKSRSAGAAYWQIGAYGVRMIREYISEYGVCFVISQQSNVSKPDSVGRLAPVQEAASGQNFHKENQVIS